MGAVARKAFVSYRDPYELAAVIDRGEARKSPSLQRFEHPDLFHDREPEDAGEPNLIDVIAATANKRAEADDDEHERFLGSIRALKRGGKR